MDYVRFFAIFCIFICNLICNFRDFGLQFAMQFWSYLIQNSSNAVPGYDVLDVYQHIKQFLVCNEKT